MRQSLIFRAVGTQCGRANNFRGSNRQPLQRQLPGNWQLDNALCSPGLPPLCRS
jgi:hypothetical protein